MAMHRGLKHQQPQHHQVVLQHEAHVVVLMILLKPLARTSQNKWTRLHFTVRVCNYGWWRCKRLHVRSRKRGRSEGFGCQGVSLYLETGEDAALTLTQRPPPVDGVHRLTVEDRPFEQLHHHPTHLCVITQAGAVRWQQWLWDRFQMTVGKMTRLFSKYGRRLE